MLKQNKPKHTRKQPEPILRVEVFFLFKLNSRNVLWLRLSKLCDSFTFASSINFTATSFICSIDCARARTSLKRSLKRKIWDFVFGRNWIRTETILPDCLSLLASVGIGPRDSNRFSILSSVRSSCSYNFSRDWRVSRHCAIVRFLNELLWFC